MKSVEKSVPVKPALGEELQMTVQSNMSFQVLATLMLLWSSVSGQYGYSYSSFSGPVSGEIRQVPVQQHYNPHQHAAATHHHPSYNVKVDYVVSNTGLHFLLFWYVSLSDNH
jgi:hypothetical protein